jgi:hypothetical protein
MFSKWIYFLCTFSAVCVSSLGFGQHLLLPDGTGKAQLAMSANLRAEGWGLSANRAFRFYQRGFLDSTFLTETLARMSPKARFALENTAQIYGGWRLDSSGQAANLQIGFEIRNASVFSGSFQRDLFELIFLGNQNFIGKTVTGDGFYLRTTAYRTWSICASRNFSIKNHRLWLQVFLGWVQGLNHSDIAFSQLRFTTEAQSAGLGVALTGEQQYLRDRNRAFFGVNGNGLSFSGNLKWETPSNYKIVVHWEDLGWVNWKKANRERWDTAVQFKGFSLDASTLLNNRPQWDTDSIWQVSKADQEAKNNIMLPFLWSVSLDKKLAGGRWGIFSEIRQRIGYQNLPWIQAGVGYSIRRHQLEASMGGGGQGGFGLRVGWIHHWKSLGMQWILQLPLSGIGPYAMSGLQTRASFLYRFGD